MARKRLVKQIKGRNGIARIFEHTGWFPGALPFKGGANYYELVVLRGRHLKTRKLGTNLHKLSSFAGEFVK